MLSDSWVLYGFQGPSCLLVLTNPGRCSVISRWMGMPKLTRPTLLVSWVCLNFYTKTPWCMVHGHVYTILFLTDCSLLSTRYRLHPHDWWELSFYLTQRAASSFTLSACGCISACIWDGYILERSKQLTVVLEMPDLWRVRFGWEG
jgi:hypothetical protein